VNPRTPVLAAAATLSFDSDPGETPEALEMASQAVRQLGHPDLLRKVGLVLVPKGTWTYGDPGRVVATAIGADARTVVAEVGVLQQTPLSWACDAVAHGDADAVLVVGFEAKRREVLAARAGIELQVTHAPGPPDELLLPHGDILTRAEIERDLAVPAHQYAIVENALRHADGLDHAQHLDRLGRLWSGFAAVARDEMGSFDRSGPGPTDITTPSPDNRMIASPYTKRLCSQWNVDQAVALLFASSECADAHGVSRDQWTFPVMAAESNHMTVMPARAELHRSPATGLLGDALREGPGLDASQVDHLDLYSCFPAAVQVQVRELGIEVDRALTVTGGMTFAGGPLNSYVLHAVAAMSQVLREGDGTTGLATSVSGMLTKTGLGLWSAEPPDEPWYAIDVSAEAEDATELRPWDPDGTGTGRIVSATVVHDRGEPARLAAVVELGGGARTVAVEPDPTVAADLVETDLCDHAVAIVAPGVMTIA
jgi:acetyl-CoA C-acetyltransferase